MEINWKALAKAVKTTNLEMFSSIIAVCIYIILFLGPFIIVILTQNWWFIFLYIVSIYIYKIIDNYFAETKNDIDI